MGHGNSKYKPEYCEQIIEHMRNGDSAISFAKSIDVCMDTITEWKNKHSEFSAAYKKAKAYCEEHWIKEGQKGMWNHKDGPTLNTGVWAFFMKCRFGWNDRPEIKVSSNEKKLVIDFGEDDNE